MTFEVTGFERPLYVMIVADTEKEVFSSVLGYDVGLLSAHATDAETGSDVSFSVLDVDP